MLEFDGRRVSTWSRVALLDEMNRRKKIGESFMI